MSSALREGSPLDRGTPLSGYDPGFAEKLARHLNDPQVLIGLLAEFKEYMVQYLALNQPPLSVANLIGFTQHTVQQATTVVTSETTASDTYTDLATAGPTIEGLSDGQYAIFFGGYAHNTTATGGAVMSVQVNATAASDDDAASLFAAATAAYPDGGASISRVIFKTLNTGGSNTLTVKYRRGNATGTAAFSTRWLAALRYANA